MPPSPRSSSMTSNLFTVLRACALSMASLYVGFYLGYKEGVSATSRMLSDGLVTCTKNAPNVDLQAPIQRQTLESTATTTTASSTTCPPCPTCPVCTTKQPQQSTSTSSTSTVKDTHVSSKWDPLFPPTTSQFVSGMSLVDRDEFIKEFDTGHPFSKSNDQNRQVLVLHGSRAMPTNSTNRAPNTHLNTRQATQHCNYLSLILTEPNRLDQCIAIVGQYNSYHIYKHMRTNPKAHPAKIDSKLPLALVKRGKDIRPFHTKTPDLQTTKSFWRLTLQPYLTKYQDYLDQLRPIAQTVAARANNTIIVMVSNHGQSELLMNFVCNARARQLDLGSVLVFATDAETEQLSKGLGLATFYDADLFNAIPKQHAARFGDQTYKLAIFSKLYCVHLVGMLGYHYLFQDIDMIWYKHPFDFFHNDPKNPPYGQQFDIYMQTDGNMAQFYAPYSGNTGFYYVRNTPATQYFMNHFLVSGDLILSTSTHQAPFLTILAEHASLHGIKVKILPPDDFPGGAHYNRDYRYMKYLLNVTTAPQGVTIDPWIFHMSWTENKDNKAKFFSQMGEWYVRDTCLPGGEEDKASHNKTATTTKADVEGSDIGLPASPFIYSGEETPLTQKCCAAKPIIKCYYSDTPSIIPCHDSSPMTKGRDSFHPKKKTDKAKTSKTSKEKDAKTIIKEALKKQSAHRRNDI